MIQVKKDWRLCEIFLQKYFHNLSNSFSILTLIECYLHANKTCFNSKMNYFKDDSDNCHAERQGWEYVMYTCVIWLSFPTINYRLCVHACMCQSMSFLVQTITWRPSAWSLKQAEFNLTSRKSELLSEKQSLNQRGKFPPLRVVHLLCEANLQALGLLMCLVACFLLGTSVFKELHSSLLHDLGITQKLVTVKTNLGGKAVMFSYCSAQLEIFNTTLE